MRQLRSARRERHDDQTMNARPIVANTSTTQVVRSARNKRRKDSKSSPVIRLDL